jgi:hypothetical protein
MKIQDLHPDIKRYLEEDCYCQHEVYSFDGFSYMLVYPEEECISLGSLSYYTDENILFCIRKEIDNHIESRIVVCFFINLTDNKCKDALRFDATENNLNIVNTWIKNNKIEKSNFDRYYSGETAKGIEELLARCDAIEIHN